MKQLLLFAATILATTVLGQTKNSKTSDTFSNTTKVQESDTALQVIYVEKNKLHQHPAYFINGRFIKNKTLPANINPQSIENIEVIKRDTLIDNVRYYGQVYMEIKEGYTPKFITLTELKNKYTNLKGKPTVFILDGHFINENQDDYLVDESNLLTIIIDNFKTVQEKIDIGLIKLLTKTKENIKARKQIIIRGAHLTMHRQTTTKTGFLL